MSWKIESVRLADEANVEELRYGIDQTRREMSATLGAIEGRLKPEVLGEKAKAELDQLELRVKAAMKESLEEAKVAVSASLKEGVAEARAAVTQGLSEARETVKSDVKDAITYTQKSVREATVGRVEQMATRAGDIMNDTRDTLVQTIRQNPIPAALAGIGVAWLLMNRSAANRSRQGMGDYRYDARLGFGGYGVDRRAPTGGSRLVADMGHAISTAEHTVVQTAGSAAHRASESASHVGAAVVGAAHGATAAARHAMGHGVEVVDRLTHQATEAAGRIAHDAGETARQGARNMESGVATAWGANPLAFGAAAVVAGAALGYALPRTQMENRLMGEARDAAIHGVAERATGAVRSMQEAADDAGKAAKEAVSARVSP